MRSVSLLAASVFAAVSLTTSPTTGQSQDRGEAAGFVELFDGKTLDGWVTEGGRYDGKAAWSVEDGAITGREGENRAGGLIYTARSDYRNYVFVCDTKISYPFDSGVFVRMVPRSDGRKGMQITLDYRPGGEVGGIYADGWLQHQPDGSDKFKRDEWNRIAVYCAGADYHTKFWLNGELLTEYRLPADADRSKYAPAGKIGLQVHGSRGDPAECTAQFKNVRILELPEFDPAAFTCDEFGVLTPTEVGAAAGWEPLFSGEDLTGWEAVGHDGDTSGYVVRDGVLVFPKKGKDGYLRTTADFRDFELRFDFKLGFMANSGLFLRGDRVGGGNPAYSGCEIQLLDDHNWERVTNSKLAPWQFTGSLYASVPPAVSALRPLESWNTMHVVYRGSQLRVELNGQELYDVDTHDVPVAYENQKKFADRAASGFIGLQRHAPSEARGDYAWFKNAYVRRIPSGK